MDAKPAYIRIHIICITVLVYFVKREKVRRNSNTFEECELLL